ncbi:MAG: Na/Pi cotransporter family protein [Solobacterium sp.]|nr:Na/Pi cotransporter family protein [Solobacterium sp.]
MDIFSVLNLFGGLAMFLYGMRLMGDGLKESSSGTLKAAMESVTNNPFKAFILGVLVTAIIQSSTATIVITSGLVAAGIISLTQSVPIIIGANIGTTVTGQIIRLLDLDSGASGILQLFRPSTLAPVALIIGIVMIMGVKVKNARTIGNIAIGFGILFTGLLTMTDAVDALGQTGLFEMIFTRLGVNPVLGYLSGVIVSFILQSSSATIGILQAFSASGALTFHAVYPIIVGVYLGDCVTTAIVIYLGSPAPAKRVGIVNILYNLMKSAAVLITVALLHRFGLLNSLWDRTATSGLIANTNSLFNIVCAFALFPMLKVFENASYKIVKDDAVEVNKYSEKLDALNPNFVKTPALALNSCYELLLEMYYAVRDNIDAGLSLVDHYDQSVVETIRREEDDINLVADRLGDYLALLSANLREENHVSILNEYYRVVEVFEQMGDRAKDIADSVEDLERKGGAFSDTAKREMVVLKELIDKVMEYTEQAFKKRDVEAARHIEPLEETVDDVTEAMKSRHLERLADGKCSVYAATNFMDLVTQVESVSDRCSDVGFSILARVYPDLLDRSHDYLYRLHSGQDDGYNAEFKEVHGYYFGRLAEIIETEDYGE